jgi:hypothetical protein
MKKRNAVWISWVLSIDGDWEMASCVETEQEAIDKREDYYRHFPHERKLDIIRIRKYVVEEESR